MRKQYHILNGDVLKEQFPEDIQGEVIIARECLVDGNVDGNNLTDFFKTRAKFISSNYEGCNEEDYFEKTVPEFQKMLSIPNNVDINLWFEDDLFCQVNLWFVIHLLSKSKYNYSLFLIRPTILNSFGFGGLNKSELISIYENKTNLVQLDELASLWKFYKKNDTKELIRIAKELKSPYPFILNAVQAHIERIPTNENIGRPSRSIIRIMKEMNTIDFKIIFKEFCKQEPTYGYGDLQVKRLFDEILKTN